MNIQRNVFKGALASVTAVALFGISHAQTRDFRAFNTTMEGRGTARVNGVNYTFRQLQLTLQSNERVTIHALLYANDERDVIMSGRLRNRASSRGNLVAEIDRVTYGRDIDVADATATINMSTGERFNSVRVSGRNTSDRNSVSLDFTSNGREVTSFQRPGRDRIYDGKDWDRDRGRDRDRDRDDDRRRAHGLYTDADEWRRRGEHFLVRYNLDLDRNGRAKMTIKSEEDRNMPNDRWSKQAHGQVLEYLERGRTITQTGRWTQNGNDITITFDRMEIGSRDRNQREVLKGEIRNGTIWMDQYDKDFYGHRVTLTFERRNIFR